MRLTASSIRGHRDLAGVDQIGQRGFELLEVLRLALKHVDAGP